MALNLVSSTYQHNLMDGENFRLICYLNTKLWSSKFIELDVCGRPLFANPVTYAQLIQECERETIVIVDEYRH